MAAGMDLTFNKDSEDPHQEPPKKLRYPKTVFFIVVTEFCERFAYYGMRAVLTVYMRNVLNFSDDQATSIYHVFLFLCYFLPLFGAILADSFMGKYRTIVLLSSIFAAGNFLLTGASLPPLNLPVTAISLLGLFLMAVGTGGIKPCVAPLGGDQFVLPQQERQLKQFFSVFTFAVSVGNMCSTMITPILRSDVQCFNQDCYPLAFGIPAGLMVVALVIFIVGRPFYVVNKPKENIILRVFQCMAHALKQRREEKSKHTEVKPIKRHWVDYADHKGSKFDKQLIEDTKGLLRVLVYYLPIPMFWALYEQLGSRWTLQATRMNGNLGSFSIQPDQMQVANAILMFTFIPIFETVLYPLLAKCSGFRRPLQRMVAGGLLAALSFLLAGLVELRIERTDFKLPAVNQTHLMVVNTLACPVQCEIKRGNSSEEASSFEVEAQFQTILWSVKERNLEMFCATMTNHYGSKCGNTLTNTTQLSWSGLIDTIPGKLQAVIITTDCGGTALKVNSLNESEDTVKSKQGYAKLRFLNFDCFSKGNATRSSVGPSQQRVTVAGDRGTYDLVSNISSSSISPVDHQFRPGKYSLKISYLKNSGNGSKTTADTGGMVDVDLQTGGNYLMIFHRNSSKLNGQLVAVIQPNEIHMLWLLPQYVVMAWGEILFIISGMEFSFTEAPVSMKSVLQSCWHLTNAAGNLMVIIAAQNKGGHSQATEFFIFASLMLVDAIVFGFMAARYKYVNLGKQEVTSNSNNDGNIRSGHDEKIAGIPEKEGKGASVSSDGEETRL